MAKKKYEEANIQAIADTIRTKTGTEQTYKTSEMANGVNEVYDKGRDDYKTWLWKRLQQNGNAYRYDCAFAITWKKDMFYPMYNMKPSNSASMFSSFDLWGTDEPMDLVERLSECGVTLDFSKCTNFVNTFYYARIAHVGVVDLTSMSAMSNVFGNSHVNTIDKLIIKADGSQNLSSLFNEHRTLKTIGEIEGKIGKTITFQYTNVLDVPSMKLIISHLVNHKGTASEATQKITFTSTCWEALEASGKPFDDGLTDDENLSWKEYVMDSLGWLT